LSSVLVVRTLAATLSGVMMLIPDADAAAGDAGRGESVFRSACGVCHTVVAGYHKDGPSLHGVFGRPAGSVQSFTRYRGMKGLDVVWDEAALDGLLADPKAFLGGANTSMTFRLQNEQDRADVIAYLKTIR
jgi:cytochrome c